MRIAFISDIHGNLEALKAVIEDIDQTRSVDYIYCNGDIVGYYPNPVECIDIIKERCEYTIQGNHDAAITTRNFSKRIEWFNPIAAKALTWTRNRLLKPDADVQFQFLKSLKPRKEFQLENRQVLLAHGTPEKKWEYFLYPYWIDEPLLEQKVRISQWLKKWDLVVLGHTHWAFYYKNRGKITLNPGSVGQPRDEDSRASYAIVDFTKTTMKPQIIRLKYDISKTCSALSSTNLPEILCERLYLGK
ncbi:MAG: metallophosphoesterase [Candidatus Heimdallarchaeota archaeon]|nr:metallophosphoesterase [Candidatus Heimdallarchaeota archaeon]